MNRIERIAMRIAGGKQDTAEDIAVDVLTRVDIGKDISQAFREIGYGKLWNSTRESDMPLGWEWLTGDKRVKALSLAIEKGMKRLGN